jgi:hypothetical protein
MTDQLLDQCVERFSSARGPFERKMGAVLTYLADELTKDAFPYAYCSSSELFVDAEKLKQRLLNAVSGHPEARVASYEAHLAKLREERPCSLPPGLIVPVADNSRNNKSVCC